MIMQIALPSLPMRLRIVEKGILHADGLFCQSQIAPVISKQLMAATARTADQEARCMLSAAR